jgi:hypothetical protein
MGRAAYLIGTKVAMAKLTIRTSRPFRISVIATTHKAKTKSCRKFETTSSEMHGMVRFSCCARVMLIFLRILSTSVNAGVPHDPETRPDLDSVIDENVSAPSHDDNGNPIPTISVSESSS